MATMREAVIVEAVRTAVGRRNGRLKDWHPVDLMAQVLSALVQRTGVDTNLVEDVIIGCVSQVGEQSLNVGRNAASRLVFPKQCLALPLIVSVGRASRQSTSPRRESSAAPTTWQSPVVSSR